MGVVFAFLITFVAPQWFLMSFARWITTGRPTWKSSLIGISLVPMFCMGFAIWILRDPLICMPDDPGDCQRSSAVSIASLGVALFYFLIGLCIMLVDYLNRLLK